MIKTFTVKGYESHKDTTVHLSSGVNIFVGVTDHGKSSLFRALKWLVTNKPIGYNFRSWWGPKETEVKVKLDNGLQVTRIKTKSTNTYKLARPTKGKKLKVSKFTAFNKGVPDKIRGTLNMPAINWQEQFEAPYLLSRTGGEVARELNKVASLTVIDTALSNVNSRAKRNAIQLEEERERVKELKRELKDFPNLDSFEQTMVELEAMQSEREELTDSMVLLTTNIADTQVQQTALNEYKALLPAEEEVDKLLVLCAKRKELVARRDKLSVFQNFINQKVCRLKEVEVEQGELQSEFEEKMPDICPLCNTNLEEKEC